MTAPVFVDTNVLIRARDAGEPLEQARAAEWLAYLWRRRAGRISTQVLSEYYTAVTRKLRPGLAKEEAWDDVQALSAWRPQAIDEGVLRRARDVEARYDLAWWDCLIVAAAQAQGCAVLLSADLQDGGIYGGVLVRSPFTLALEEETAVYAVLPSAVRGHPPRGRPRTGVRGRVSQAA
jgi:predicted nucleic acid-binding protein